MMIFTLSWPPTVNTYWRRVGNRTLISRRGREYRKDVVAALRGLQGLGHARLAVRIEAYPPDKRRRDLDNITKSLLDSLAHAGAYADDEQIDDLRIVRGPVSKGGYVRVRIEAIGAQA